MIETLFLLSVQSHILQIGRCTVYWAVVFRKLQCISVSDAWLKSSFKQSEWIYISLLKKTRDYSTAKIRLESSIIWQRILKREGHRERPCFYFFFLSLFQEVVSEHQPERRNYYFLYQMMITKNWLQNQITRSWHRWGCIFVIKEKECSIRQSSTVAMR